MLSKFNWTSADQSKTKKCEIVSYRIVRCANHRFIVAVYVIYIIVYYFMFMRAYRQCFYTAARWGRELEIQEKRDDWTEIPVSGTLLQTFINVNYLYIVSRNDIRTMTVSQSERGATQSRAVRGQDRQVMQRHPRDKTTVWRTRTEHKERKRK